MNKIKIESLTSCKIYKMDRYEILGKQETVEKRNFQRREIMDVIFYRKYFKNICSMFINNENARLFAFESEHTS